METVKQPALESPQISEITHVRLLADYIAHDDVTVVHSGELCEVLAYHGDDWVYVSRGAEYGNQSLYVPASYVQRVDASPLPCPGNATSSSLTRARTFNSSSAPKVMIDTSAFLRSVSLCENASPDVTTNDDSWYTDDLPDPPPQSNVISLPGNLTTSSSSPRLSDSGGVPDSSDVSELSTRKASDQRRQQREQHPKEEDHQQAETSMYANWAEIQKLANNRSESSTKQAANKSAGGVRPIGKPPTPERSPATLLTTSPATSPGHDSSPTRNHHRSPSGHHHHHPELQSSGQLEEGAVDILNMTLLNKLGYLSCLHANENGKSVVPAQWILVFIALRGALLTFYENEAAAETRADGSMPLPIKSLGLQGALVQFTRYGYPAYDVIQITTSFNTMYIFRADTAQDTQSWCRYLKHNVAVLLADRTALMESATPVSTFTSSSSSPKLRGKLASRSDSVSAVSRVAQRLKELLNRRPTKEDLENRGIYTEPLFGSTLSAVCAKDKTSVPLFLSHCFKQIELRGLTMVGIYRLSGSISKVQKLRIRANQGDYNVADIDDIHTLTGIVRVFLRELAEPLIPFEFFERFCDCYKKNIPSARQEPFARLIQELPQENRLTLQELFRHLEKVIENNAENQMSSHNLAIVFGPTLMWLPVQHDRNYAATVMLQGQIVEYLIQEHRNLFNR